MLMRTELLSVLLAVELSSLDQRGQLADSLLSGTGLQTAVRVDPELLRLEVLEHLLDTLLDLIHGGNTRRVDIVDTRSNVGGETLINEDLEELGIGLAVLDGQNIGIKGSNSVEEVLEFTVAEVGVDLGAVGDTSSRQLESIDSPLNISITGSASTQRKTLTQGRLVDLDDLDSGLFQIKHLVSESESKLLSLDTLVDIVTRE